ncbi:MAG: hypothetical protein AB1Z51_00945 [Desulfuromonadales bacterium]
MKPDHLTAEVTADSPPLNLNERRILHNRFRQETGHESRSKDSTWDCQAVVPQKRG